MSQIGRCLSLPLLRPLSVCTQISIGILLAALLGFCGTPLANAQKMANSGVENLPVAARQAPPQELLFESLASYGHYKIFASGSGAKLYTSGLEYDRNSWGTFLRAQMDYVGEFLPLVLLDTARKSDIWGTPLGTARHVVPGMGISPIGFRMMWRPGKGVKPYLEAKGGMIAFTDKVLSQEATYENFSLQSQAGLLVKATSRYDLRLGLFGDFHFSNAFMVPINPGLDVMNASFAVSYHLGKRSGPQ